MDKKSYINISMSEDTEEVEFACDGDFDAVTYLAFEILNQLKKRVSKLGFTDEEAAGFILEGAEIALTTFE